MPPSYPSGVAPLLKAARGGKTSPLFVVFVYAIHGKPSTHAQSILYPAFLRKAQIPINMVFGFKSPVDNDQTETVRAVFDIDLTENCRRKSPLGAARYVVQRCE